MTLNARSTLRHVAAAVARALRMARVDAVLTGGACAHLHSAGRHTSFDVDFVLRSSTDQRHLDEALATLGYRRVHDHYVHATCPFWIEFVAGPLGIGQDLHITPIELVVDRTRVVALSPTDSCRDRLAAFISGTIDKA